MKTNLTYKHFTLDNTSFFKGIGILLIAFHNFFHWVSPNPSENEFDFSVDRIHNLWNGLVHHPLDSINLLFSYFGHYGVQLFILFSGYGLMRAYMNRKISWSGFMLKRLNKLYPTFIIAGLILIGLNFFKYNTILGFTNIRDFFIKFSFLSNFIPGKALTINGPWWFYSMIVQLYAVFPLIVWLYKKFKETSLLILTILSYVALILFNDYFVKYDVTLYYQFIGHLPEFLLGVYFATRKEIKLNIFVVLGFLILFIFGNLYKLPWYFSHLSITILLFVLVNYIFKKLNKSKRTYKGIIFYGEVSMYLFAIHGFLRAPFVALANEKGNSVYTILIAIAFVATSTIIALGVKNIEKNYLDIRKKIIDYLNKIESKKIFSKIFDFFRLYYKYVIILIISLMILKLAELLLINHSHPSVNIGANEYYIAIFNEFFNIIGQSILFIIPFSILFFIHRKTTKIILAITVFLILVVNFILIQYFNTTLVPLDHVIFIYTFNGLLKIVSSSVEINFFTFVPFILILVFVLLFVRLFKKLHLSTLFIITIFIMSFIFIKAHKHFITPNKNFKNDTQYFYTNNKLTYLVLDIKHYFKEKNKQKTSNDDLNKYIDLYHKKVEKNYLSNEYPLLYNDDYKVNTLGNFFEKGKKPNIVYIIVESLCDQISGKYASIGSFTPFLDSLEQHSLYWRNNVSSSERTFGVLPTVLGSLPPAKTGFMETDNSMPLHFSILSLLSKQKYTSNFYYGGWMDFDNMKTFLLKNQINNLISDYDTTYKLDTAKYDSWGYPDQVVFAKGAQDFVSKKQPFVDIFLTLSTHSPFLLKNQEKYIEKTKKRIEEKGYNSEFLQSELNVRIMSTVMYLDDALRLYFDKIKNSENFKNTIFIITGDHKMGPVPAESNIKKYHVPLIIYSPMLKKHEEFGAMSSHYDICPSIVSLLKNNFDVDFPPQEHFIGSNIDTTKEFKTNCFAPFMRINRDILDICYKGKFLSDGKVYKVGDKLKLTVDNEQNNEIKDLYSSFKEINNYVCDNNKIIPVNLYRSLNILSYLFLLQTNFEKNIPDYYDNNISDDVSSSKNKSLVINPKNEYVTIIPEQNIDDKYNRLFFNVEFKVFVEDTTNGTPLIVCHIVDKNSKTVFWQKIDFMSDKKVELNTWTNINANMQIPVDNPQQGYIFKSYFWNSKSKFYIDDLDVSINGNMWLKKQ